MSEFRDIKNSMFSIAQSQPCPHLIKLFCFPHAGGGPQSLFSFKNSLASKLDVHIANLPGRGARFSVPAHTSISAIVQDAYNELEPYLVGNYVLFGHSMGAIIAFELARLIEKKGYPPARLLIVSGCSSPRNRNSNENIHRLSDKDFIAKLETYSGTPKEVIHNSELMKLIIPTIRADFQAVENYIYHKNNILKCSMLALTGDQDHHVTEEEIFKWGIETENSFRIEKFCGGHFFIDSASDEVANSICKALEI